MTVRDTILREAKTNTPDILQAEKDAVLLDKVLEFTHRDYVGKRIIDIILSVIGLGIFALLVPFLFIGVKLSSKGPFFFKQNRTGLNGKRFECYKIRTMHTIYEKLSLDKPAITQKKDNRIFSFGLFLRRLNLDELPQLVNVLKGEMSLVGPRPYMVDECQYWNNTFEDFYYRYAVKPGLTGLAQVQGLRGGTLDEESMRLRLDQDLIYLEKQSMSLDLKIMTNTALQMLHFETNAH